MVHELTSEQTADAIEAGGLEITAYRTTGTPVAIGDGCVILSADGSTFIGDVIDAAAHTTSVRVRLR